MCSVKYRDILFIMRTIIFILLGVLAVFALYKYFSLDINTYFQESVKERNFKKAESVLRETISEKLQTEASAYFYEHNNYFVSKSNNLCMSAKSLFAGLEQFTSNPVECVARVHSFTARVKSLRADTYFCADAKGFYTIPVTEEAFVSGVKCN